jgi:hypothetical protein
MRITRNVPVRLTAFAVAALLALAGGAALGAAVGPIDEPGPTHAPTHAPNPTTTSVHGGHAGMSVGIPR